MQDLLTQARLVEASTLTTGVGTIVSRSEIAAALAAPERPARLVLDVTRADDDDVTAHGRITVDWDETDLERVLLATREDDIALWFDRGELERVFDDDEVEAHGLRGRAAALAVVVAAAGATAGSTLAAPGTYATVGGGGASGPALSSAPVATDTGGGSSAPSSGELAGIAGGAALLITAAGFAARSRTRSVRPA